MPKKLSCIAVAALAGGLWFAVPGARSIQAQTITFGAHGVQVIPNSPDGDRYHSDRRDRAYGDHHYDYHWREVRHRMREYRAECQYGDRGSCVRLGIIIGENQARRGEWRREHPSYFWWDRD